MTNRPAFSWTADTAVNAASSGISWPSVTVAVLCFLGGVVTGYYSSTQYASPRSSVALNSNAQVQVVQGDDTPSGVQPAPTFAQSPSALPTQTEPTPPAAPPTKKSSNPVPAMIVNPNSTSSLKQAPSSRVTRAQRGERLGTPTNPGAAKPHIRHATPVRRSKHENSASDYSSLRRSLLQN